MLVLVSCWFCYIYAIMETQEGGKINYTCSGRQKRKINLPFYSWNDYFYPGNLRKVAKMLLCTFE